MKLIVALIQPHQLPDVKKSLLDSGISRMTVVNALGCGQQGGFDETYRGVIHEVNLMKKVRIEIAVNDDFEDVTIEAITKGARTGKIGDGKIFVTDLARCIRIRTGETGEEAVG